MLDFLSVAALGGKIMSQDVRQGQLILEMGERDGGLPLIKGKMRSCCCVPPYTQAGHLHLGLGNGRVTGRHETMCPRTNFLGPLVPPK